MEIEVQRLERQAGYIVYRVWAEYGTDSIGFEPEELLALQQWIQEHEDEITQDALYNRAKDEMKGM